VKHRAACAYNISLVIFWMNACFHFRRSRFRAGSQEARNLISRGRECKI
jgi:hypothetical protein